MVGWAGTAGEGAWAKACPANARASAERSSFCRSIVDVQVLFSNVPIVRILSQQANVLSLVCAISYSSLAFFAIAAPVRSSHNAHWNKGKGRTMKSGLTNAVLALALCAAPMA